MRQRFLISLTKIQLYSYIQKGLTMCELIFNLTVEEYKKEKN